MSATPLRGALALATLACPSILFAEAAQPAPPRPLLIAATGDDGKLITRMSRQIDALREQVGRMELTRLIDRISVDEVAPAVVALAGKGRR